MKTTKNYFLLLMLTLGIGLFTASCSSSDDNNGGKGREDDNPPPPQKELILTVSKTTVKLNETVNFSAKFNGEIIKDVQYILDGQGLDGENYTFTEVGDFTIQAKKATGETSNKVTVSVFEDDAEIENATKFAHRVLVEDFTGIWCGWCPLVAHDIEVLEKEHGEKLQAIAIHNGDSFDFFRRERAAYESYVGVTGYPTATINRKGNFRQNPNKVVDLHKPFSTIGIKIDSEVYANDGIIKVGIKFGEDYAQGVKYAAFLLEDHLFDKQAYYADDYYKDLERDPRDQNYLLNFEHNNTLVGLVNGFLGEEINSSTTGKGQEFTNTNLYFTHKAKVLDNTKVVIVVSDMNGEVLNVAVAKANTNMDYQVVR